MIHSVSHQFRSFGTDVDVEELQTNIPRLSRTLPPAETSEGTPLEPTSETIEQFIDNLRESVRLRVENIPPSTDSRCVQLGLEVVLFSSCNDAVSLFCISSRLAVLFSGVIDCAFIAHLVST